MKDGTRVECLAILALMVMEVVAMLKGIDGVMFSLVVASIAGIAGYELRPKMEAVRDAVRRKNKQNIDEQVRKTI